MQYLTLILTALTLMVAPAHGGSATPGVSASGTVAAIGTSYTTAKALECTDTTTVEASAKRFPGGARLGWVHLEISSISSVATVTWFVAADATLDIPISLEKTSTIFAPGVTTATDGSVVQSFELMPYVPITPGSVWIGAKGDAGTFSAVARCYWER